MNELSTFLIETILGEAAKIDKVVVVYSGRFQPFHKGHYATYDNLVRKFGKDSVYIGTSNVTDSKKSPFNFKEKKVIMTTMFGIPSNKIVNIKNPYAPEEILKKYDEDTTGLIVVVGEKDENRLSGKYFTPYKGKVTEPYLDRGYVYASPATANPISGTDVRYWLSAGSAADRKKNFTKAYPTFDDQIFKLITLKLKSLKECINEEIKLNVKVGDTLLMGKFKNKKVVVKSIGEDEWGMPTINGKKAVTFRIPKKENLKEINLGGYGADPGEPDTGYIPDGKSRVLNTTKPEPWFNQGGYTQLHTPTADDMRGKGKSKDTETQFRKAYYKVKNITQSTLNPADDPYTVEDWEETEPNKEIDKPKRFWELPDNQKDTIISKEDIKEIVADFDALLDEMGLPGGAGVGLSLPGGYINGAPDSKDVKKNSKKLNNKGMSGYEEIDEDNIPGGLANGKTTKDLANKYNVELSKIKEYLTNGIKVEMEHTTDVRIAAEIAMDHLWEDLKYYDKLAKKEIDEVGEGSSKPYSFTQRENEKDNKVYAFTTTSKENYKVEFDYKDLRDAWEMEFDIYFGSGDAVINKGEIYSVMATVTNIALDFIKKVNPKIIYFRAAKNFNNDNRREKLYLAYIKKQLPNWTLGKQSGLTTLTNPKYKNQPTLSEGLLLEGGAYGHMAHPFDIEMNLTFGDLKQIVVRALNGDLELAREKTDGQALAVSWVNGRLVAARNKSHLKNKGAGAMTIGQVADKFAGRGGLTDAYNFAMQDLSKAIGALSEPQRKKVFKDGSSFMNLEVIYPTSVNVIPYNQPLLVFHGTFDYDMDGTIVGENQQAASILGGMIKQVNAHIQSKYTIQGPPMNKLPKSENLSKLQGKYLGMITKLQNEFKLVDSDGVADYHQAWWTNFVEKGAKKLDTQEKIGLIKRWAFGDKGFRINTIQDTKLKAWAEQTDKEDQQRISKQNLMKFEEIFLGVGADVLSFMTSVLTANPDSAKRQMVARLESTIQQVKASGDPKKIAKLKLELERLNTLGGFDKIVPNEGIVFVYGGNTYKLTGAFAPLNQILGIFFDS